MSLTHLYYCLVWILLCCTAQYVDAADLAAVRKCGLRDAVCVRQAALDIALDVAREQLVREKDSVVSPSQWLSTLSEQFSDAEWNTISESFSKMPHSEHFMEDMNEWRSRKRQDSVAGEDPAQLPDGSLPSNARIDELEKEILEDGTGIFGAGYALKQWAGVLADKVRQKDSDLVPAFTRYQYYRNAYLKETFGSYYYTDQGDIDFALALFQVYGCVPTDKQLDGWRISIMSYNGEFDALRIKYEVPREPVETLAHLSRLLKATGGVTVPKTQSSPLECLLQ